MNFARFLSPAVVVVVVVVATTVSLQLFYLLALRPLVRLAAGATFI